jgi:farnesyl diphosphate synthase
MLPSVVKKRILGMSQEYNQNLILSLLDYNLTGGKEFRLRAYTHAFLSLGGVETDQSVTVGYTLELIQALFLIIDDIMDNSEHRRGKPCFYIGRGMVALKDAYYLLAAAKKLQCIAIGQVCSEQVFKAALGQTHDSLRKTKSSFTMDNYHKICDSKSGSYTLYMPAIFAYLESGSRIPDRLGEFCRIGGILFQIQDDYLNFFPSKSGKSANDLEEGKCTWFTCEMALMNIPVVTRYFDSGIVGNELLEVVKGLFPKYYATVDGMAEKMRGLVEEEDKKALDMFLRLLSARKCHD